MVETRQRKQKEAGNRVFATVGTTRFDQLINALDSRVSHTPDVQEALWKRGFSSLTIQRGKSGAEPKRRCDLALEVYDFKPSLATDMQGAGLIISHGGAGCIMESLRMGKKMIVVANDSLMDNHQMELAHAMQAAGYVAVATPATLAGVIASCQDQDVVPLPPVDSAALVREMESLPLRGIRWQSKK